MELATVQSTVVPQNCAFSRQGYTGDPFLFMDGHYIGHVGFVVPQDFNEFYQRFPEYIRRWVNRHADTSVPKEDIEDWTQDLCVHMSSLPATSKLRLCFCRHNAVDKLGTVLPLIQGDVPSLPGLSRCIELT